MDNFILSKDDTILYIRTFFLLATSALLISNVIPAMEYYLVYGSRALPTADSKDTRNEARQAKPDTKKPADGPFIKLLDRTFAHPIPHSWFHHFYTCSVVSSLFWGHQILTQGPVLRTLAGNAASPDSKDSMSVNQVVLVWALIAIQGSRRLYESISYRKQSTSRMQFSHWLLGILYYLAVGLEVWIEGSDAILAQRSTLDGLTISAPSLRTILFLPIFILASGVQYDCHAYLASLQKYTLPVHPIFNLLICPHYTAECFIYVALMFLAAPRGAMINKTILTNLIFVVTNLGISAEANRKWYAQKFGHDKIAGRWNMLPYVY